MSESNGTTHRTAAVRDRNDLLSGWTVFDRPADYPDYFVARRWVAYRDGSVAQTRNVLIASTLEALQEKLANAGLYRLSRQEGDDPSIVEVWL